MLAVRVVMILHDTVVRISTRLYLVNLHDKVVLLKYERGSLQHTQGLFWFGVRSSRDNW